LFAISYVNAQSAPSNVISSQGGYSTNNEYSLEWTLGEVVATTYFSNTIYTQGFNQSFLVVKKVTNSSGNNLIRVVVAPNPVTTSLTVAAENTNLSEYAVTMTHVSGVKVYHKYPNSSNNVLSIDMQGLANGVYLLQVYDTRNKVIHTSKIIKL
jgi:hypothetical protein